MSFLVNSQIILKYFAFLCKLSNQKCIILIFITLSRTTNSVTISKGQNLLESYTQGDYTNLTYKATIKKNVCTLYHCGYLFNILIDAVWLLLASIQSVIMFLPHVELPCFFAYLSEFQTQKFIFFHCNFYLYQLFTWEKIKL